MAKVTQKTSTNTHTCTPMCANEHQVALPAFTQGANSRWLGHCNPGSKFQAESALKADTNSSTLEYEMQSQILLKSERWAFSCCCVKQTQMAGQPEDWSQAVLLHYIFPLQLLGITGLVTNKMLLELKCTYKPTHLRGEIILYSAYFMHHFWTHFLDQMRSLWGKH